jgi:hypothetical protein
MHTHAFAHTAPVQLTDRGVRQAFALGTALRSLYVDKLGLIVPSDPATVHIRSTSVLRALETARAVSAGLLADPVTGSAPSYILPIFTHHDSAENMHPGQVCPRARQLRSNYRKSEEARNLEKDSSILRAQVAAALGQRESDLPSLFQMFDECSCRLAHGMGLPGQLTLDHYRKLEHFAIARMFLDLIRSPEIARLAMGPFLGDFIAPLQSHMQAIKAGGNAAPIAPLHLFSGHDTTIGPVMVMLGLLHEDSRWPDYTSSITLELLRERNQDAPLWARLKPGRRPDLWVRALVDGQPKPMPFCRQHTRSGSNNELCDAHHFMAEMKKLIPTKLAEECSALP